MMFVWYILFAFIALALSLIVNALFLKFSTNLGLRSPDNLIRWAAQSKPSVGGFSLYIVFLFSFVAQVILISGDTMPVSQIGLLLACTLGFLIGLADDAYNTKPLLKFMGQVFCGLILYFSDNGLALFPIEGFNFILTILWVAGLMNSINMLDNMDGITSSISLIIVIGMIFGGIFIYQFEGDNTGLVILTGVAGALFGFLYFNWNPARIYMGDTGSMFLGVFLAAMSIQYLWNGSFNPDHVHPALVQTSMVWLFFVVPIADTLTVSINRLLSGKSPFVGGKDHTTHHLAYLGLKDRVVALLLIFISLICIAWALFLWTQERPILAWQFWVNISLCSIVTIALYSTTVFGKKRETKEE
jgi:UDP-GlcNAc:undecaprenyl-phosphate GlcNAc-1-phosphate transferase